MLSVDERYAIDRRHYEIVTRLPRIAATALKFGPHMKAITFSGPLERSDKGYLNTHIIRCPFDVEAAFGSKGTVRVFVTINGHRMDRALIPDGDGGHHIIFGGEHRKLAGMRPGGTYQLSIVRNENPLDMVIPEELRAALDADEAAAAQWAKLKPGNHRNIVYWVGSAKRPETREKRAIEMIRRLTTPGTLFGNKPIT